MFFADRLTLDKPRRSSDGYMAVHAKAARAGVYQYLGREVDPEGKTFAADQVVNVYRPEDEVFDKASLGSFVGKPITDDHPSQAVTADNWRNLARGTVMGAARDGEFVGFDLAFLDADTIRSVDGGKHELSNGYSCDLSFEDGTAPDGTAYQAVQRNIRGNHVAVVDRGRAGSTCRIGDAASCDPILSDAVAAMLVDERTYNGGLGDGKTGPDTNCRPKDGEPKMPHTLIVDGLQVPNVSDEAKVAIEKLQGQLKDERDGRAADKSAHDKAIAAKDAEIDDLKGKVVDQTKIDQLADAKAAVVADAKRIAGDKLGDTAGKSVVEVRRMACAAVLGDAAVADKSDDYVEARFDTLKDAKGDDKPDALRDTLKSKPATVGDNAAVRDAARAMQYS